MTNRKWRVAIAGLGAAARQIHLPAYRKIPNLEVVGGFDPAVGRIDSIPLFTGVDEMLAATRADLFAVLTPPEAHADLVRQGLRAGCHVLCEKPVAPTLEEGQELAQVAAESDRQVVVNQEFRYMEIHRKSREWIGREGFGELLFLQAVQTFRRRAETEAGWRGQGRWRTCLEFGVHVLDLCRFFFGEEALAITAHMPDFGESEAPDHLVSIYLEFPRGRAASILLDRVTRGRHRYLEMRLDGSEGCIETQLGGSAEVRSGLRGGRKIPFMELDISGGGRARLYQGESFRRIGSDPLNLFAHATRELVTEMLQALEQEQTPPCCLSDHLKSLALVEAAYRSAATRDRLELDSARS